MCLNFGAMDNSSSNSMHSGCVGDDLFEISKDHSTESYSSQAWSVQWRWQLLLRCEGQGMDGYSGEHECDDSRI